MNILWRFVDYMDKEHFWWLPVITVAYFYGHFMWWIVR